MSDAVEFIEQPAAKEMYMFTGWRQWADAGSTSSGLPEYLVQQLGARKIGSIRPDGFYIFQIPGTHDLVRPVVKFDEGYPESLEIQSNELFFAEHKQHGMLIFLGDEPHLDVERYTQSLLHMATTLRVKRIIGFGGVYGELPYNQDRLISSVYSLPKLKQELEDVAVNLSDYHGGASVGSYVCRRAGDLGLEYVSFYAFVPAYDFSNVAQIGNSIRIENDYMAWLGIMQRVNHMLQLDLDLTDLEQKSKDLISVFDSKIEELEKAAPELGVRDYLDRIADGFNVPSFTPLDDVWEEELRRLFGQSDSGDSSSLESE